MRHKARWFVVAAVIGSILVYNQAVGGASEPESLRRLALENRVAEVIADLNLTSQQKQELKEVAEKYRAAQESARTELAHLLARRRDALLDGDREAVAQIEASLRELAKQNPLASDESVGQFVDGLTERQKQVLSRILPGIAWSEDKSGERSEMRMGPRWTPRRWFSGPELPSLPDLPEPPNRRRPSGPDGWPQSMHRMPRQIVQSFVMHGFSPEAIDVLIDLLER